MVAPELSRLGARGAGKRGMGRIHFKAEPGNVASVDLCLSARVVSAEVQAALKIEDQVIELFDQVRVPIYRYLVCIHISPQEADEIIQDTFLRLFEVLHAGERIENPKGWAFRVAHNLGVNGIKGRKYVAQMSSEEWLDLIESRMDPAPGPEELLLLNEKMSRLHSTISTLPQQQQQCLHLRTEGFRYREIAEILGVAIPTVAESLRRAIEKLTLERHG